ncbi:MAG: hypothetical protein II945_00895 [Bacteroidales bacterium]|nr:hypothetical protein [Bacteroidales bacterium]
MESIKKIITGIIILFSLVNNFYAQQVPGKTPFAISISEQGSVRCEIPIRVPSGVAGVQPDISLDYNSSRGFGLLGYGWELSGISYIRRDAKDLYLDGKIASVQMDTSDRFCLNGQRMIRIGNASQYMVEGGEFGLEEEDFTRIKCYNIAGSPPKPQYFIATFDNGTAARYAISELQARYSWYIDSVADINGNYMRYYYTRTSGNCVRIDSIAYTGNHYTGQAPFNTVVFLYDTLDAVYPKYVKNMKINRNYLLSEVIIKAEGIIKHRYVMEYNTSNNKYFLNKIIEYNENNEFFKPIEFTYSLPESFSSKILISDQLNGNQQTVLHGYFYYTDSMNTLRLHLVDGNLYYRRDSDNQDVSPFGSFNLNNLIHDNTIPRKFTALACDINNDNMDDIILTIGASTNNNSIYDTGWIYYGKIGQMQRLTNTGNPSQVVFGHFDNNKQMDCLCVKNGRLYVYPDFVKNRIGSQTSITVETDDKLVTLDIDGDGIMELMIVRTSGATIYKNAQQANINLQSLTTESRISYTFPHNLYVYFGDVNNDGITDMIKQTIPYWSTDAVWTVYLGTGNGFSTEPYYTDIEVGVWDDNSYIQLADLNADHMSDIVIVRDLGASAGMYVHAINGFGQLNGISHCYTDEYHITQSGISKLPGTALGFGDCNNDGLTDLFWFDNNDSVRVLQRNSDKNGHCLKKITDGQNNTYHFQYHSYNVHLKNNSVINSLACNVHINPYLIDTMILKKNNDTITQCKRYTYQNVVFDTLRNVFLGFTQIINYDSIQMIWEEKVFKYKDSFHTLVPIESYTYNNSGSSVSNPNITSWHSIIKDVNILNLGNKRRKIYYTSVEDRDRYCRNITSYVSDPTGRIIETTYFKGHFGSIPSREMQHHDTAWKVNTKITYDMVPARNGSYVNKISQQTIIRQVQTDTSDYFYDTIVYTYSNGNLASSTLYQQGKTSKEQYLYNDYGLPESKTIGVNLNRTETYTYDSLHRFVTGICKSNGLSEHRTFDPYYGNVLSYSDYNNNTTNYTYDGFGRILKQESPDGSYTKWKYCIGVPPEAEGLGVKYYIKKQINITGLINFHWISYFDAFDQEVLTRTDKRFIQRKYNVWGLLESESFPYLQEDENIYFTNYQYNNLQLLSGKTSPLCNLFYQYEQPTDNYLKTIVTDSLRGITYANTMDDEKRLYDASNDISGQLGGSVYASYKMVNGKMQVATVNDDNDTSYAYYDTRGNLTETICPDAGNNTYTYNEFDEILSHTDANGNTAVYQYDSIGRIIRIIYNDTGIMQYTYDDALIKGTLVEEAFNGKRICYSYDTLARVIQKTFHPDSQHAYSYNYTYDTLGRLSTLTYPGSFCINYHYDHLGNISKIRYGDTIIYQAVRMSDKYLVPAMWQVNQTATTLNFNDFGMINSKVSGKVEFTVGTDYPIVPGGDIILGSGNGTMHIQESDTGGSMPIPVHISQKDSCFAEYYYTYDSAGRIIMIANHPPIPSYYMFTYSDNDYQSEEYFAYDPLDRLTYNGRMDINHMPVSFGNISFNLAVPVIDTMMCMNYTGVKMTSNSAVGNFLYNAPQPHAVSEVQPVNDSVISADQCDITYNVFNKTHTINEAGKRYTIDYYPNQQRAMTTYTVNNTEQEKKIYCGREYEHNLTTNTQYNYIYVGDMPIALYVQGDTNAMYTLHTNYIGSIEKITNTAGEIVDSMSYTPFGQRRMFSDWSKTDTATHFIDRGFTGQQHLDKFALINFNGRMYDPVLAHFLSPDPYIQSPENPLNYNRYSYCLFSPLQYVDPSGMTIEITGEDGSKTIYTQGMQYNGNDEFTKRAIDALNGMNSTKNGSVVLHDLVESLEIFTITNELGRKGNQCFTENKISGGKIKMGALTEDQKQNIFDISHELFHGYQYINKQGGRSIFNEIEAYSFAYSVIMTFSISGCPDILDRGISQEYSDAVNNLLNGDYFSITDFNIVLQGFKKFALENQEGTYDNYPLQRTNQTKNLIQSFYPLINW